MTPQVGDLWSRMAELHKWATKPSRPATATEPDNPEYGLVVWQCQNCEQECAGENPDYLCRDCAKAKKKSWEQLRNPARRKPHQKIGMTKLQEFCRSTTPDPGWMEINTEKIPPVDLLIKENIRILAAQGYTEAEIKEIHRFRNAVYHQPHQ